MGAGLAQYEAPRSDVIGAFAREAPRALQAFWRSWKRVDIVEEASTQLEAVTRFTQWR
jgi:hypothetical protein